MPAQLYVAVVALLTCLSGVGAFALLWPRDVSKPRPFRTWPITLLVLGLAAPAIIAVPIFNADFLTDNGLDWLEWAFYAACLTSLGLIAAAIIGDRSRGRRRCPRCWYDMAGAPAGSLTCPECGKTVRHEQGLFRSRRRAVLYLVAFLPTVAALLPWNALYYRSPDWPRGLSNTALTFAAPFAHHHRGLTTELERSLPNLMDSTNPREFSQWQQSMLLHFARRAQVDPAQARESLTACRTLIAFQADDTVTVNTLATIASSSPMYGTDALKLLAFINNDAPTAKAALLRELNSGAPTAYLAAIALINIMPRAPGGPAPAALFNNGTIGAANSPQLTTRLLCWFDPCDESRATLIAALDNPRTRPVAIVSLATLWPREPESSQRLLDAVRFSADAAKDRTSEPVRAIYTLVYDEMQRQHFLAPPKSIPSERLALYTPELCSELERWLPLLDSTDTAYSRIPEQAFGRTLRQILEQARASHSPATLKP